MYTHGRADLTLQVRITPGSTGRGPGVCRNGLSLSRHGYEHQWAGSGQAIRFAVCQAIREVLLGSNPPGVLSGRAKSELTDIRADFRDALSILDGIRSTLAQRPSRSLTIACTSPGSKKK